jgi:hypothetical protein
VSGINGRAPRFMVVDNPRANRTEQQLARDIADALGWRGPVDRDPTNLAGMLALVRDGYTLEGPRRVVSGYAQLPRAVYEGPDRERAIESATVAAWRSWFAELVRERLRPCGWPAVQRTHLAFGMLSSSADPYVEVDTDDERAEILMLSVTCEAVPAIGGGPRP